MCSFRCIFTKSPKLPNSGHWLASTTRAHNVASAHATLSQSHSPRPRTGNSEATRNEKRDTGPVTHARTRRGVGRGGESRRHRRRHRFARHRRRHRRPSAQSSLVAACANAEPLAPLICIVMLKMIGCNTGRGVPRAPEGMEESAGARTQTDPKMGGVERHQVQSETGMGRRSSRRFQSSRHWHWVFREWWHHMRGAHAWHWNCHCHRKRPPCLLCCGQAAGSGDLCRFRLPLRLLPCCNLRVRLLNRLPSMQAHRCE